MRCLIKRNAQSSLFPDLCLALDLGYIIAVPLILLESPCVSTGETGNKNWALNLFFCAQFRSIYEKTACLFIEGFSLILKEEMRLQSAKLHSD